MVSLSNNNQDDYLSSQTNDEYIHMLFLRENSLPSLSSVDERTRCARLHSVAWILRSRATLGFQFQTAYLSVAYLDHFLLRRSINMENGWAIRLLSVACLRIAAKMEECNVPLLLEFFGVEKSDLFKFDSHVVQRMELLVLSTLEWNLRLVTPFAYINRLISSCCEDQSIKRSINSRCIQIIMSSMRDLNLMSHRPSIIAVAATLVALDSKMTDPELELNIIAHSLFPSKFLKTADIVSCYSRMREQSNTESATLLECVESPSISRVGLGEEKCFESCIISGFGNKRKRLVYKDYDRKDGKPDGTRP